MFAEQLLGLAGEIIKATPWDGTINADEVRTAIESRLEKRITSQEVSEAIGKSLDMMIGSSTLNRAGMIIVKPQDFVTSWRMLVIVMMVVKYGDEFLHLLENNHPNHGNWEE